MANLRFSKACVTALATAGLLFGAFLVPGGALASPDTSKIAFHLLDYAKDVNHGFFVNRSDQHPEVDLLEASSALDGAAVKLSLQVRGSAATDNASYSYGWTVCYHAVDPLTGFGCADATVTFSNGSATLREAGGALLNITVVAAAGSQIQVSAPLTAFANFTGTWRLKATATDSGDGYWFDSADLDVNGGALLPGDISNDTTPFTSPTVSIASVVVQGGGSHFRLTATGTTSGAVGELRVGVGDESNLGGTVVWEWSGWWREENLTAGDPNVTLEQVGGSWASWQFTRDFDPSGYTYGLIDFSKLEVRAIAPDGAWGHANRTCACGTSAGPIPAQNSGGNGGGQNSTAAPAKGFLPGPEAGAALAAVAGAAAAARRKRT